MHFWGFVLLMLSFVFAGVSCFSLFSLSPALTRSKRILFGAVSLGYGPLLISFLLGLLFSVLPGKTEQFYLVTILAVCALPILWAIVSAPKELLYSSSTMSASQVTLGFGRTIDWILWCTLALLLILAFMSVALFPLYSNDPLEYFKTAQILSDKRDLFYYPVVDSNASNGFYGPWTHPPGFVGLLVWSNFFSPEGHVPGLARFVSWYYALATALLLIIWSPRLGVLAAILFLAVPIYFAGISSSHIDPVRIFPIAALFVVFHFYFISAKGFLHLSFVVTSAVGIGLCFFVHSIGILVAPIWGFCYLLAYFLGKTGFVRLVVSGVLVFVLAACMMSPFLYSNYQKTGSIISDTPEVWALEKIKHKQFIAAQRKIDTPIRKTVNGVFKGIKNIKSYGFIYWLFVFSLIIFYLEGKNICRNGNSLRDFFELHSIEVLSCLVVLSYFLMTVAGTLVGTDAFIKNDRYPLTIHPFLAIFSSYGLLVGTRWLFRDR